MDCSVSLLWVSWLWAVCTIISPIIFLISGSKAYRRVSQNRWRTLGNVHSPSYRMIWRRAGWRPPVPVWSCSVKLPAQSEDQPIGWFELEEDWNDVEIKLQQCRIAKVRTRAHTHALLIPPPWLPVSAQSSELGRFYWLYIKTNRNLKALLAPHELFLFT